MAVEKVLNEDTVTVDRQELQTVSWGRPAIQEDGILDAMTLPQE